MLRVTLLAAPSGTCPMVVLVRENTVPAPWAQAALAEGFTGAAETACDIIGGPTRTLLVGVGEAPDPLAMEAAGAMAAARLLRSPHAAIDLRGWPKRHAAACLAGAVQRAWHYDTLRTQPFEDGPLLAQLDAITDDPALAKAWEKQNAALTGCAFARDLVTEPSNTLTPLGFAAKLSRLQAAGVQVQIMTGDALVQARLDGLLNVGRAAANPPALAILRWPGEQDTPPVAFVGKGITFDTGGISIKPADLMWEMRADMAGAAACAGAMLALALRNAPAPAFAVLALAENAVGDNAYRPSDILCHANGTTVEVIDTDAEGRLVLMDALGWAAAQNPAAIIDLATLTGSVVVALGHVMAGLFDNDAALAASVAAAGAAVGEPVWRLPIDESHRRALDSDIADLRHCSPERMQPDASQAAAFLREFVGETPWVHLDIAGVENWAEADDRYAAGATGFGVRLLDRLVQDRFEDAHRA